MSHGLSVFRKQAIKSLEYSPLKKTMLGGAGESGRVVLWDVTKQAAVAQFASHGAPASGVSFSKVNDSLLVSTGLGTASVALSVSGVERFP